MRDIGKILTAGTPKQRILLVAEDVARANYQEERLLTDHQLNQMSESFKKPNEIKLWNKWLQVDRRLIMAIANLQGLKWRVLTELSDLRGYLLVWETLQEAETLSNHILHEIKDPKERIKISTQASKLCKFILSDIQVDKAGYLNIDIGSEDKKGVDLWTGLSNVRTQVIEQATVFISWKQAILDYMEEEGFPIKIHKTKIQEMTEDIEKPLLGWRKYLPENKFIPGHSHRADKIKAKYSFIPELKKLQINAEIYERFKKELLKKDE